MALNSLKNMVSKEVRYGGGVSLNPKEKGRGVVKSLYNYLLETGKVIEPKEAKRLAKRIAKGKEKWNG